VTTILTDGFEGAFPGRWFLVDNAPFDAEHTLWGQRSCRAADGVYSAWASGGGSDGAARPCGAEHGQNVHSWLLFGPFSLQGAARAALDVRLWLNSGPGDGLSVMASRDGTTFYGDRLSGSTGGWVSHRLDLAAVPGAGSLLERTTVWIAIAFDSDAAGALPEGAYVDAVHLWRSDGAVVPLADETAVAAGRVSASAPGGSIMAAPVAQSLAR